jgi:ubiquinone/menaquinone biosynthesis C-methylase UbiE
MVDYASITETPGLKATREQIERLFHRYRFASDYVRGKDVLEVACGSGIGLRFLAKQAKTAVGGDVDKRNLATAADLCLHEGITVQEMDAHTLPFGKDCFDIVLLYEAIYYLEHPELFVKEAYRTLRPQGVLILCTVNRDWKDFHPSPYTYRYLSVPQLAELLRPPFQVVQCYGAFSTHDGRISGKIASLIKRAAIALHLIPGSLAARAYLKRVFIGPLQPLPWHLDNGTAPYAQPVPISIDHITMDYKIIYAVATKA